MARKHTLDEVLKSLAKKNDCIVMQAQKIVFVYSQSATARANDLGNGSWGKISYLQNTHGYMLAFVADIGKSAQDLEKRNSLSMDSQFRLPRRTPQKASVANG